VEGERGLPKDREVGSVLYQGRTEMLKIEEEGGGNKEIE